MVYLILYVDEIRERKVVFDVGYCYGAAFAVVAVDRRVLFLFGDGICRYARDLKLLALQVFRELERCHYVALLGVVASGLCIVVNDLRGVVCILDDKPNLL